MIIKKSKKITTNFEFPPDELLSIEQLATHMLNFFALPPPPPLQSTPSSSAFVAGVTR